MKSLIHNFFCSFCIILILLSSCNSDKAPDVSNIKVNLDTRRLDVDLGNIDTTNISAGLQSLKGKYPDFLDFYLDTIMGLGIYGNYAATNPAVSENLHSFLSYKDYRGLFDTVKKHFPDTKSIDADLAKGFQYLKYYDPAFHVPKVVYFLSFLAGSNAITVDTSIAGIALDMYLGPDYPYYASVGHPAYMTRVFLPQYAVVNVMKVIYRLKHPFIEQERPLLDLMIQRGQEQYFLSKVLPFTNDSLRLGYTKEQLDWANNYESMAFSYYAQQQLLYNSQTSLVMRYVVEGPSAYGMPRESPGSIGTFTGYQIVKAWVQKHPKAKMEEVCSPKEPQKFLEESGYKP